MATPQPNALDFAADRGLLISGLTTLGFRTEIVHAVEDLPDKLRHAATPLAFKDCIDVLRTIYEEIVEDAVRAFPVLIPAQPRNHFKAWNDQLVPAGVFTDVDRDLSQKLYSALSQTGTHRLGSDFDEVRIAGYFVVGLALLIVRRVQARTWILGQWQGQHIGLVMDDTHFDFSYYAAGGLSWEMTRETTINGYSGKLLASGRVDRVTHTAVQLDGIYANASELETSGKRLSYKLERKGDDVLEGRGQGIQPRSFPVKLRRVQSG